MSSQFSEEILVKRLGDLNQTQNSIQTLSTWLIHYRKHAKAVAKVWYKEYRKAQPLMKLTFIYLANDIIQNSRKKGSEYCKVFAAVLPAAYKEATRVGDAKTHDSLRRLTTIWKDRQVYEDPFLEQLNSILSKKKPKREKDEKQRKPERKPAQPATGPAGHSDKNRSIGGSKRSIQEVDSGAVGGGTVDANAKNSESPMKKIKTGDILSLRDELDAQLAKDRCEPPDLEEMIIELSALLKSPSADSVTRHRIASFPTEVGDYGALNNIRTRRDCDAMLRHTTEADEVLVKYKENLQDELQDRKRVAILLRTFLLHQNDKVKTLEVRLKEYQEKLSQVNEVRSELSSHLSKLPDLSMLPDTSGGLAPLPTVDVLFN